jgi:hypothetical protein
MGRAKVMTSGLVVLFMLFNPLNGHVVVPAAVRQPECFQAGRA